MKGRLKFVIVLGALAIAVPASAWAFTSRDYSGSVRSDPSGFVGFNVDRNAAGKRVATAVTAGNISYTCDTAPDGRSGGFISDAKFRIRHHVFDGKDNVTDSGLDPVLRIHGKLKPGGIAQGTIQLKGHLDAANPTAVCDTGELNWAATRGPFPF